MKPLGWDNAERGAEERSEVGGQKSGREKDDEVATGRRGDKARDFITRESDADDPPAKPAKSNHENLISIGYQLPGTMGCEFGRGG